MCSDVAISVEKISKVYRIYDRPQDRFLQMITAGRVCRYREFAALSDISFEVDKGESVGIVGANGSGKSTLLQIICGTLSPSSGSLAVRGRLSALLELGAGFNPEFTGLENVFLNGAILGLSEDEMREKLDEILAFADIGDFVHQPVKTYSSGMFVRLAFAVAVNVNPDILIVDEALAVGDNLFQKRCFAKLEGMLARGVTLLFVSHDQESIRTLTSRCLLLDQGKQLFFGPSSEGLLRYRKLLHEKETEYLLRYEPSWMVTKGDKNCSLSLGPQEGEDLKVEPLSSNQQDIESSAVTVTEHQEQTESKGLVRSEMMRFGDGAAKVLSVDILDKDDQISHSFKPLELLKIRLKVRVLQDLNRLNVGIRIRNKQGIKVYSWGTLNQDIGIWIGHKTGEAFWDRSFEAGSVFCVELACELALGAGFYEIQSYVAQEQSRYFSQQRILDWCDEAAFFNVTVVLTDYFFGGLCDLQMRAAVIDLLPGTPNDNSSEQRVC